ncbi:MAG TPA: Tad domain-containing protein [Micromonosporaceae bacterium]
MSVNGRHLGRRRPRGTARRDRGGVAIIVAFLLGSGVLLGMAALVIDVGNLYAERRQLQGGADAAAIKVAEICATRPAACSSSAQNEANHYARANARDGAAAADVCGSESYFPDDCPKLPEQVDCVGSPPAGGTYVQVQTSTLEQDGSTALPPVFAQAVLGGFKGAQVAACARAAWGPPARANGLAMAISICDWERGKGFPDPPEELFIPQYDEKAAGACGQAGTSSNNAGGFRWLAGPDESCRAMVVVEPGYQVAPGNSGTPNGCGDALTGALKSGRPVLVPVFDAVSGKGGNADYTIHGFAAFVVTGWRLPGSQTRPACDDGSSSCVYGYFTQAVVPGGGALGGPDLGAQIVSLVG